MTSSRDEPLLRVADIHKSYPPTVIALKGASLDLLSGEITALLGANGAGESTLARILSGIEQPSAGSLSIGGKKVRLHGPTAALRQASR